MRTRIGLPRAVLEGVAELAKTLGLSPEEVIIGLVAEELPETLAVTAASAFDGRRISRTAPPPVAWPGVVGVASGLTDVDASVSLPAGAPVVGEASGGVG